MEIKKLINTLDEISKKEKQDFYYELYPDRSCVIKIIRKKPFAIHCKLNKLEEITNELKEKGWKQFILDNNDGSYKVYIPDEEYEKMKIQ